MTIASLIALLNDRGLDAIFIAWLAWSLKGTVLLFITWVVTLALRGRTAAMRHWVWASGLAGLLLLPAFSRVVPTMHVGWLADVWSASPAGAPVARSRADRDPAARGVERIVLQPTQLPAVSPSAESAVAIGDLKYNSPKRTITLPSIAALAWLAVMVLLLARALAGILQLSVWSRRSDIVRDADWLTLTQRLAREMQISRPVTLLQSDRACVPMTWGVVYPRILLPADADSWLSGRRTVVLLHELAHIKRLDTLTQLLAQVSTALFWFHPAVWFAAREMRREREHACDDFVLDAGARASEYAHSLLQIARPLVGRAPAAAALAMARKSELEGRLLAILDPRIDRRPASRVRLAFASVVLVGLAIPLAAVSPTHAAPPRAAAAMTPVRQATNAVVVDPAVKAPVPVTRSTTSPAATTRTTAAPPSVDSTVASTPASPPASDIPLPPPVAARERLVWTPLTPRVLQRTPDVETLIAVTRAAAKMTSDHDKAEVLLSVAKHYVPDNELRSAYLDAVLSMHNDFDRARTLEPVLMKDSLPASATPQLVRIAAGMNSDNGRATIVMRLANSHPSPSASTRSAVIALAGVLRSDFERARCIVAIARRGGLTGDDAVRLIGVAKPISSSTSKADALIAIASSHSLDTPELRRAYIAAAETITSAFDYRRAIVRAIE